LSRAVCWTCIYFFKQLDFCWPFPISPYLNRLCLLAAHTFNFRVFIVNFVPRASLKLVLKGPLLQCFYKTQSNRMDGWIVFY
jgi:hypothetical protein